MSFIHYTNDCQIIGCKAEHRPNGDGMSEILHSKDSLHDPVNHPKHYTTHPSGIECIDVTEHMNFCLGNAVKYLWRCDDKGDPIENLEKARWYIKQEIKRRKKLAQ